MLSQASSQGLEGEGGHQVPLRLFCVRRRREALAPLSCVMLGSEGVVKTRGEGVRGLKTPCEWGTEAGAAVPPAGYAHTNGTRRSRARETPPGRHSACLRRWATIGFPPASVHASRRGSRQTRPWHTTACLLCVPGWEGDGLGPARTGPQEDKRGRASNPREGTTRQAPPPPDPGEGTTRQVPSIAASRGRRPPLGPLGLLTQGGVSWRTHAWELRTRDERVGGARAILCRPSPARATDKAATARPAQGNWSRSSHALPGEAGCTRASTPDPTMPFPWASHDAEHFEDTWTARMTLRGWGTA